MTDEGVTLIELLMTIAIASIIGAMILSSIIAITNLTVRMTERAEDTIEARVTTDEITTNLRAATIDPLNPDYGVFAIASINEIKFLTRGGQGFSQPPRWVHYRSKGSDIYRVDEHGRETLMMAGLDWVSPFRFYTFDPQFRNDGYGNCYISLDDNDLAQPEMRRRIVGMQVQINRRAGDNVRELKFSHSGEFVRIPEQTAPETVYTGERLQHWRNTCWESQVLRIKPATRPSGP